MTNQTTTHKCIYCCECQNQSQARLVSGKEIYPHRSDLYSKNIWQCDTCKNYVGCHDNSKNPFKELGFIAGKEMKKARQHIHAILDPMWKNNKDKTRRGFLYNLIARELGRKEYHTAKIKTIEEAREVYKIVKKIPLLIRNHENQKELDMEEYLLIKPIKNKIYLVRNNPYKENWVKTTFSERKKSYCQLHGEPYLDYYFQNPSISFSIDGDLSIKERTKILKQHIKLLD
jgi:hypothetical protein